MGETMAGYIFNPIKTEAILFTTFNLQNKQILTFDHTLLTFVEKHIHKQWL